MKTFIKKLLFFVLIYALILLINFSLNSYFIKINIPEIDANTLIIGDSYVNRAINPKFLNSSVNISISTEPYFVTYFKLKKLLETNDFNTVLLGYSYHNLSAFNDRKFNDSFWSNQIFQITYPIISFSEFKNLKVDYLAYFKVINKYMCLFPRLKHNNYIGSFQNDYKERKKFNHNLWIEKQYYYKEKNVGISSISITYLDLLIELTEKKNIKLILVATPLHKSYLANIPANFKKEFEANTFKILHKYKNVEVWDYSNKFMEDKCFRNSNHLNQNGANIFSKLIKERIVKINRLEKNRSY